MTRQFISLKKMMADMCAFNICVETGGRSESMCIPPVKNYGLDFTLPPQWSNSGKLLLGVLVCQIASKAVTYFKAIFLYCLKLLR